jgi:hypothetical protein
VLEQYEQITVSDGSVDSMAADFVSIRWSQFKAVQLRSVQGKRTLLYHVRIENMATTQVVHPKFDHRSDRCGPFDSIWFCAREPESQLIVIETWW